MKIFSRALLAFILAATAAPLAKAGVTTVSGNIYDVGKYTYSEGLEGGTYDDSAMCWAAAAANVIQHWQDTYGQYADNPYSLPNGLNSGYTAPNGTGYLNVYQTLLTYWSAGSGVSMNAIGWWMQGRWVTIPNSSIGFIYYPSNSRLKNETDALHGGYYKDVFGDYMSLIKSGDGGLPTYPNTKNASFFSAQTAYHQNPDAHLTLSEIEKTIIDAFSKEGQSVALSLLSPAGTGHAITCWGYETKTNESDEHITSLILADSDDRMYGTFMAELTVHGDGSVTLHTDRYGSWYYGEYTILDATYIATPDKNLDGSKDIAKTKTAVASISTITGAIEQSCNLTSNVSTSAPVQIGGGTYSESNIASAIIFTADGNIDIRRQSGSGASLSIKDGAMALLYGGLSIQGGGDNISMSGVDAAGHLYVHGGDVTISNCRATRSGAAAYAANPASSAIIDSGYIEIKGAGNHHFSSNKVDVSETQSSSSATIAGGGAIASEDSFSISNNGSVSFSGNVAKGHDVAGGAAYAMCNAAIDGNQAITFASNEVSAEGVLGEGGALSARFISMDGNQSITFQGNAVNVTAERYQIFQYGEEGKITQGANAGGGAVALSSYVRLFDTTGVNYVSTLSMDINHTISFINNSVSATCNDFIYSETPREADATARGGALYLAGTFTGDKASISNNTGDISFSGNTATASMKDGSDKSLAQGGAIYVGEQNTLSISKNLGNISFTGNQVTAQTAQGNDIYIGQGATVDITWNNSVKFDNTNAKKENASIYNKGTLYLAADSGHSIEFANARLDTTEGKVVLGTDSSGKRQGSGTLVFSGNSKSMSVAPGANSSATLDHIYMELGEIVGTDTKNSRVDNLLITANVSVQLQHLTMGAGNSISVGSNNVTLTDIVIDLSGMNFTTQSMGESGGTCYVYNLQNMINCSLTMNNVQFVVDGTEELGNYTAGKDAIAFYFGDDVNILDAKAVTLDIDGGNSPLYLTSKTGAVYFGENVTPPDIDVPEPATGILALAALAGLAGRRRRK